MVGAKPITKRITVWPRGVDVQDRLNNDPFQVVDVATGSSGTLTTPGLTTTAPGIPSGGVEQLIFASRARWRVRRPSARSHCARRGT